MKKMKVLFLLVLLTVASTAMVQAQKTLSLTITTNRVVSDGSSSGSTDARSVSTAARKLFNCATNHNRNHNTKQS